MWSASRSVSSVGSRLPAPISIASAASAKRSPASARWGWLRCAGRAQWRRRSSEVSMRRSDEVRFDIAGRAIAGKRFHGGTIPTIALHGWLDNANSFDAFAQVMPELDLLAMDFAG